MCKRVINYSIIVSVPFFVFFFFSEFLLSSRSIRKYIYTRSVLLHLIYPISVIIERMIALPSVLSNVYKFNSTLVFCVCVRVCMCSRVCVCVCACCVWRMRAHAPRDKYVVPMTLMLRIGETL